MCVFKNTSNLVPQFTLLLFYLADRPNSKAKNFAFSALLKLCSEFQGCLKQEERKILKEVLNQIELSPEQHEALGMACLQGVKNLTCSASHVLTSTNIINKDLFIFPCCNYDVCMCFKENLIIFWMGTSRAPQFNTIRLSAISSESLGRLHALMEEPKTSRFIEICKSEKVYERLLVGVANDYQQSLRTLNLPSEFGLDLCKAIVLRMTRLRMDEGCEGC